MVWLETVLDSPQHNLFGVGGFGSLVCLLFGGKSKEMLLVCFLAGKSRVSALLCVSVPCKHPVFQVPFMGSVFFLELQWSAPRKALLCRMLGTYQSKVQPLAAAMSLLEPFIAKELPRIAAKNKVARPMALAIRFSNPWRFTWRDQLLNQHHNVSLRELQAAKDQTPGEGLWVAG